MHAFGNDAVAKLPMPDTPEAWIRIEAEYSAAVHGVGAPVPEFLGFDEHDGRVISIYRRAFGERMWETVLDHPDQAEEHGRRLVELQELFASLVPPIVLPNQLDRIRSKIRIAARYRRPAARDDPDDCSEHRSGRVVSRRPPPEQRHSLSAAGPMVVDWFDASRGDPVGDVARTIDAPRRRPGAPASGRSPSRHPDAPAIGVPRGGGRRIRVRWRPSRAMADGGRGGPGGRAPPGRDDARRLAAMGRERRLSRRDRSTVVEGPPQRSEDCRAWLRRRGRRSRGREARPSAPASAATRAPAE